MKTWLLKYCWLLSWLSFAANALPSITPIYDVRTHLTSMGYDKHSVSAITYDSVSALLGTGRKTRGSADRAAFGKSVEFLAAETGMNPNILSGHGELIVDNASPITIVPNGTSLTVWTEHGNTISDALGNAIETGQPITLEQFPEAAGARSYLPGSVVPDYTLSPPFNPDLNIMGNPTTVSTPTPLSQLLKRGMGNVNWAACLYVK